MQGRSIITMQDYGTVHLKLRELMDVCGINRNMLARSIGARFEVGDKWYQGSIEKLDLDIFARICCVLQCKIEDILVYQK